METLILQLCFLLGAARFCGELARRLNQPAVLGELSAGLLLGPSIFGKIAPEFQARLFSESEILAALSGLGVCFLLAVTGLEIDLPLLGRKARAALWISSGGLILPFAFGLVWGWTLPPDIRGGSDRLVLSLFVAVALSISAIPVVAKVLMDLGALRTDLGQLILAASMVDDSVGWLMLSLIGKLATQGTGDPWSVAGGLLATAMFLVASLVFGPRLLRRFLEPVERYDSSARAQLSTLILLLLLAGAVTQGIGLEASLGAFLMGIMFGQSNRLKHSVGHALEMITAAFFSPLFFATAGLKVDLFALFQLPLLFHLILLVAVATVSKYLGCYLGGQKAGLSKVERLVVGAGMNPRGAMGVIVATVGLHLGVIEQSLYSLLVAMALLTSITAPPALKYFFQKLGPIEVDDPVHFVARPRRVLLPTRGGHNSELAAHILSRLHSKHEMEVTVLSVGERQALEMSNTECLRVSYQLVEDSQTPAQTISDLAEDGYDLLILGATDSAVAGSNQSGLESVVDQILQLAPCPTLVVRAPNDDEVGPFRKILVPLVGSVHSQHAIDLAGWLAQSFGSTIHLLHVIPPPDDGDVLMQESYHEHRVKFGQSLLDSYSDELRHMGFASESLLTEHAFPEQSILETLDDSFDLVILGSNFRPLSGRAFLGHRVEQVLKEANCCVMVLSAP